MQPIEVQFGQAIRELRQRLGLSQEDFADQAGIHRTYVSSIELGKVQVSIAIADKLARALGVKLSDLWRQMEGSTTTLGTSQKKPKSGKS